VTADDVVARKFAGRPWACRVCGLVDETHGTYEAAALVRLDCLCGAPLAEIDPLPVVVPRGASAG
jgi:hypothetical protein